MNISFIAAYIEVIYACLKMLSKPEAHAHKILKFLFEISLQPTNPALLQKHQNLMSSNRMISICLAVLLLASILYLKSQPGNYRDIGSVIFQ